MIIAPVVLKVLFQPNQQRPATVAACSTTSMPFLNKMFPMAGKFPHISSEVELKALHPHEMFSSEIFSPCGHSGRMSKDADAGFGELAKACQNRTSLVADATQQPLLECRWMT